MGKFQTVTYEIHNRKIKNKEGVRFAFLADLLNGRFHFHCVHHAFLTIRDFVYGPGDYFALQVILPFVRSYTLTSTVTLSPGRILI